LTDDATRARWASEGLPTDPLSVENGAIMTAASRWALMIDPQLQGVKWVKSREAAAGLVILQQGQPKYVDRVLAAIEHGTPLLLESLPAELDAVLDPVLGKATVKRGRALVIKVGDAEVEYSPNFRLYLQTKLSNPDFKPEIAAQCTIVNFCVTERGLEDQLLALVVNHERPDLQEQAAALVAQLGRYTIALKELEDSLLARLANARGDILEDTELVANLEETKRTALDVEERVAAARATEASISVAREAYRPVAARGALLYFLVDGLHALDRCVCLFVRGFKRGWLKVACSLDIFHTPISSTPHNSFPTTTKTNAQRLPLLDGQLCGRACQGHGRDARRRRRGARGA
jgi:dynein heavy chain